MLVRRRAVQARLAAGALVLAASGCGSSGRESSAPGRPLPSYGGHAAQVFDDGIEPAAVGMDFERAYLPKTDQALRERSQLSDGVLRVRVSTVTAKKDGPESIYQVGLHTVEKLAGQNPPAEDFTVTISKGSDSFGILKSMEARLIGVPFVAFVREFVRSDGDREIHFHFAPDTKDVKLAVGDAVILGELK